MTIATRPRRPRGLAVREAPTARTRRVDSANLASRTDSRSIEEIASIVLDIAHHVRHQYTIADAPLDPRDGTYRAIRLDSWRSGGFRSGPDPGYRATRANDTRRGVPLPSPGACPPPERADGTVLHPGIRDNRACPGVDCVAPCAARDSPQFSSSACAGRPAGAQVVVGRLGRHRGGSDWRRRARRARRGPRRGGTRVGRHPDGTGWRLRIRERPCGPCDRASRVRGLPARQQVGPGRSGPPHDGAAARP